MISGTVIGWKFQIKAPVMHETPALARAVINGVKEANYHKLNLCSNIPNFSVVV